MEEWEEIATIVYADGATIKSQLNRATGDVCLILARTHDDPDENYVVTQQQAQEIVYVLSKAIVEYNTVIGDEEEK